MNIPAISQVIEQCIRVCITIIAILMFMFKEWTICQAGALAILASALGFLGPSLYLLATRSFRLQLNQHSYPIPRRQLILVTLVFALSQLLVVLWQFIDSFTVAHMLQTCGLGSKGAIIQKGIYDRGTSFIQIGLIVTTTFSFVLIPLLTDATSDRNQVLMNRYTNASLKITLLISVAAGIGLINILPMMNHVLFKTDQLSFTLSIYTLTVTGVSFIMMDIALLQVMNHTRPTFIGVMSGLLFKIIFNMIFVYFMGILGASISTVLSLIILVTILRHEVVKYYRFNRMRTFIVKLMSVLVMISVVIQGLRVLLPPVGRLGSLIELLIIVGAGGLIFPLFVMYMNILGYRELKHLPFGDKLYRTKKGR